MTDKFRFENFNLIYHTSCSFERGWVALGGRLSVGLLFRGFWEDWGARGKACEIRKEKK